MKTSWTIADIRRSQDLTKPRIPLSTRYLCIPIAWSLTVVALQLGMTANRVTFMRLFLALVALFMMSHSYSYWFYTGLALFLLFVIMDSVDGNIARVKDQATYYGKFLDGFVDNIGDFLFPLAVAAHVSRTGDAEGAFLAAAIATLSLATIFTVLNRNTMLELAFELREGSVPVLKSPVGSWGQVILRSRLWNVCEKLDAHGMNVAFDLRYAGLAIALIAGGAFLEYLYFLATINAATAAFYIVFRLIRSYFLLDVHRRSRSASGYL